MRDVNDGRTFMHTIHTETWVVKKEVWSLIDGGVYDTKVPELQGVQARHVPEGSAMVVERVARAMLAVQHSAYSLEFTKAKPVARLVPRSDKPELQHAAITRWVADLRMSLGTADHVDWTYYDLVPTLMSESTTFRVAVMADRLRDQFDGAVELLVPLTT